MECITQIFRQSGFKISNKGRKLLVTQLQDFLKARHYLNYLLEKLPNDSMDDEELELLAPWNESVKAKIQKQAGNTNS